MMTLPATDAKTLAMDFLMKDLEIPEADQDFFCVVSARETGSDWYVVDIGVEGLPDKWTLQVFDVGQCDPCPAIPLCRLSLLDKITICRSFPAASPPS